MNHILHVICNGLTSAGTRRHTLINSALVTLALAPSLLPFQPAQTSAARLWVGCFVIAVVIQLALPLYAVRPTGFFSASANPT